MKEVLNFLNKVGVYYLATNDSQQAHVRPIGFAMEHDDKIAFCVGNNKNMYKQLVSNPNVEICAYDGEKILRVCGKAVFITSEVTQNKALEVMPMLKNIYAVGDGLFEIYCLENMTAFYSNMAGEKWEI